jgi:hypothetical protein
MNMNEENRSPSDESASEGELAGNDGDSEQPPLSSRS